MSFNSQQHLAALDTLRVIRNCIETSPSSGETIALLKRGAQEIALLPVEHQEAERADLFTAAVERNYY